MPETKAKKPYHRRKEENMEMTEATEVLTEEQGIVFDTEDISAEAGDAAPSDTIQEAAVQEASAETAQGEWELEVKYNGEQQKLNRAQAVEMAQKGLNYDKIAERLKAAESSEEMVQLKKLAADAGMKPSEYLSGVIEKLRQTDEEKLKRAYMDKGVSDKLADELVKEERQRADDRAAMNELRRELEFFKLRERAKETWTEFLKEHPDVQSYDELPAEVKESVRQGKELADAYNAYELSQLKNRLALEAQAKINSTKAPESVRSTGMAEEKDDFLKGFFGSM